MACIYGYYKEEETYYPRLYCKLNGRQCIYSKKCLKQERFIPLDNQGECYLFNMEKKKNIPDGSRFVRFEHKGYLFVEINDSHTIKIKNTLGQQVENYVYIRQKGTDYEISLSPFPVEPIQIEEQLVQFVEHIEQPKEEKVEVVETEKKKTQSTKKKKKTYVKGEN